MKTIGINDVAIIRLTTSGNVVLTVFDDNKTIIFEKEYKTFGIAKAQRTKLLNKILFIENGQKLYRDNNSYYEIVRKYGKDCFIVRCFENGIYLGTTYILRKGILASYESKYIGVFYLE